MISTSPTDGSFLPANRIVATPGICGGRPRIDGTRVSVDVLSEARAMGVGDTQLLDDYPFLTAEDLAAAWTYLAQRDRRS
jgi:uncharacterized protein (DUF433 family)